jgi:hypothetical protein
MTVVFLEEVRRQYQCNGEHQFHHGLRRSGMSIRHSGTRDSQITKRNSLLNLKFLASRDTGRLKYVQKQP